MKSPKDVLALGRVIVTQLDLPSRGAVLEHWLAHHLAEILDEVDRAAGAAKAGAESRAVDLILKLWLHRRALPEPVDPLGGYRKAIEALGCLTPDANPWRRFGRSDDDAGLLREIFEALSKTVVFGLLLSHATEVRAVTSEEKTALSSEEIEIKRMLKKWLPIAASSPKPIIDFEFTTPPDGSPRTAGADEARHKAEHDPSPLEWHAKDDEAALRARIVEEIKSAQEALETLLSRWQRNAKTLE